MFCGSEGLWDDDRPLWGAHGWNVYGETVAAVERAIRYVNENPLKEGKKRQTLVFRRPLRGAVTRSEWRSARRPCAPNNPRAALAARR